MPDTEQYRVLVVDDDPDVGELTRTVIERRALSEVRVLTDPRLARAVVEEFRPDVVVTDIEMPGMTGLALISLLRESTPGLPVVVMTAHASADYAIRAVKAQADEFLIKPVPSVELAAAVTRLAEAWRRRLADSNELTRAAEVQQGLLPKVPLDLVGYDLAGACAPARVVGGDFFDWYPVAGGLCFTLADVMGKGIGAAIIAATVRAMLRSELDRDDLAGGFAAAAARLDHDLEGAHSFVTVFHAVLNSNTGVVRYVDAGHGLSLVVRADGSVKRLATTSFPLGLAGGSEVGSGWRQHTVELSAGDTLVAASDGVLDLFDGTLASLDAVADLARTAPDARHIVDALLARAGADTPDDVTVVALRRTA